MIDGTDEHAWFRETGVAPRSPRLVQWTVQSCHDRDKRQAHHGVLDVSLESINFFWGLGTTKLVKENSRLALCMVVQEDAV